MRKRVKSVALTIFIGYLFFGTLSPVVEASGFKDVPTKYWAYKEINWVHQKGYIKGDVKKGFKPNQNLTEAEFLSALIKFIENMDETKVTKKKHWADGYYLAAKKYNLPLKGYKSNKERDLPVTHGRLARILALSQGKELDTTDAVNWLYKSKIVAKRPYSSSPVSRAQGAVYLYKMKSLELTHFVESEPEQPPVWVDKREHLDLLPFTTGDAFWDGYDKKAVQPTVANWNGTSRFIGTKDFRMAWELPLVYETGYYSITTLDHPPVIGSDGTLYIQEGYLFGPSGSGKIYAVSANGELLWSYKIGTNNNSPVIGEGGIVYVMGEDLFAFYPDGTLKWQAELKGYKGGLAIGKNGDIIVTQDVPSSNSSEVMSFSAEGKLEWSYVLTKEADFMGSQNPVVSKDGTIYCFDNYGYVYALSDSGKLIWKSKTDAYSGKITLGGDGTIYIAASQTSDFAEGGNSITPGAIIALHLEGSLKWVYKDLDISTNTRVLIGKDEHLYAAGQYKVVSLNPNGTLLWEYQNESDFGQATMAMDKNGDLFVLWNLYNSEDQIQILNNRGDLIRSIPLPNDKEEVKSIPVIGHDGSIYFTVAHEDYNKLYKMR